MCLVYCLLSAVSLLLCVCSISSVICLQYLIRCESAVSPLLCVCSISSVVCLQYLLCYLSAVSPLSPPCPLSCVMQCQCPCRGKCLYQLTVSESAEAAAESSLLTRPFLVPGVVASSCNPATRRQVLTDDLRRGVLVVTGSC